MAWIRLFFRDTSNLPIFRVSTHMQPREVNRGVWGRVNLHCLSSVDAHLEKENSGEKKKRKKKGFPMLACSLARLLGNENKTRRLTTREPHARKKSLLFGREEKKDTTFLSWAAPHQ